MGFAIVMGVGRVGSDPELRQTSNGNSVCNFSVAFNRKYTDKDGQRVEQTDWEKIVCWGKTAESCGEYLTKGRRIWFRGTLQTRSYENAQGERRWVTEIVADDVEFLDSPNKTQVEFNGQRVESFLHGI